MEQSKILSAAGVPFLKAGSNPTPSDVHVDTALTNISVAYMQDATNFIADRVFPDIPVMKQSDKYFTYNKNDWKRDEAKKRAPGAESAGASGRVSTDSYLADVWALHDDVDNQTIANADAAIDPENDAAEFLMEKMLIRREREWATNYFATSVWGTDVVGTTDFVKWDDVASSDPVEDLKNGRIKILSTTGFMPNTLVVAYEVHEALKVHPLVKDNFKYTSAASITEEMLAQFFEVDNYLVAKSIYATNQEGATAAYSFALGKNALLCYSAPSPGLKRPSAGYTFSWSGLTGLNSQGIATSRFELKRNKVIRIETEMAFDQKVVAADLGYFFSAAVD